MVPMSRFRFNNENDFILGLQIYEMEERKDVPDDLDNSLKPYQYSSREVLRVENTTCISKKW